MSVSEIIPLIKKLSYSDKLLLIQYLTDELLKEQGLVPLANQGTVASQGLHDSFEAAAVLAKALAEEKAAIHG